MEKYALTKTESKRKKEKRKLIIPKSCVVGKHPFAFQKKEEKEGRGGASRGIADMQGKKT